MSSNVLANAQVPDLYFAWVTEELQNHLSLQATIIHEIETQQFASKTGLQKPYDSCFRLTSNEVPHCAGAYPSQCSNLVLLPSYHHKFIILVSIYSR